MKQVFRVILKLFVFLYRRTNGRIGGSMQGLHVLLLTTTGRKSGRTSTTPLGYFKDNGAYVICASNAGAKQNPGWFFNLKSNPKVTVELPDKKLTATAEIPQGEERTRLWKRLIELSPAYGNYE